VILQIKKEIKKVRKLILGSIIVSFLLISPVIAGVKDIPGKVVDTSWVKEGMLKWAFISVSCAHGAFSGIVESSKYNGHYIVAADDYHIYRLAQDVTSLSSGWMLYATVRNKNMSFWGKSKRIIGTMAWRRNCFELAYRANRIGDPFNYSDKYSSNKKAILYFKWDGNKGKFVDAYISGTGKQGVAIDIIFLLVGWGLLLW